MTAPPQPIEQPDLSGNTELRRLHPITPVLRSWIVIAAGIGALWNQISNGIEGRIFGDTPGSDDGGGIAFPIWTLLFVGALVVVLTYGYLYWRFTTYGIVGNVLRIDSGVLFRRSRQVPLDRLQAVDIVRPLVARVAGVAELRLEVAGGGSSEAPLAFLSMAQAGRLRAELLARAAGIDAATPEAPERTIAQVPLQHLAMASVLSPAAAFLALMIVGGGVTLGLTGELAAAVPFVPVFIGAVIAAGRRFVVNYGFTVAESPDGLRIRKGLLDTRAQTVPPGRVQAVRLSEPFLWRPSKLVRVEINVAGYGGEGDREQEHTSVLLPVGPREVAYGLVHRVLPGADLASIEQSPAPRSARWLRPIGWHSLSVGLDERYFVSYEGWLRRDVLVMPHAKPQSIRLTQGPLQRRLGLATVTLDSTPGPVSVRALHREARSARDLLTTETGLERAARAAAIPDRWLTAPSATEHARQGDALGVRQPAEGAEPVARGEQPDV